MTERYTTPELDELFERYRLAPESTVFAPLADACRKVGMVEEALLVCARGVKTHPRYTSGYVVQGKCFYDAKRPSDAEASFRRVLELDGHNLVALKFLGIILAEQGAGDEARRCFKHILDLDPDDRDIRRRLQQLDETAPARPHSTIETTGAFPAPGTAPAPRPVPAVEPEAPEEVTDLRDVADDSFEGPAITLGNDAATSDEIATLTLADIYAAQGHAAKALRIYREVLRRQPDNEALRARIEALEGSVPEAEPQPVPSAPPASPSVDEPALAADAQERPAPGRPALPAPTNGSPIDESRSYEQFKRWLRAMS